MSWSFVTLLLAVCVGPGDAEQVFVCRQDAAVAKLQLLWQPRSLLHRTQGKTIIVVMRFCRCMFSHFQTDSCGFLIWLDT